MNFWQLEILTNVSTHRYVISLSYNAMKEYPVSSYMEDPFLSFQTLIVLLIVYSYNRKLDKKRVAGITFMFALFYVLSYGLPHPYVLQAMLVSVFLGVGNFLI